MYILLRRHLLEDDENVMGIFADKNIAINKMNELFEIDNQCYLVIFYELNKICNGKLVSYITSDFD